LVTLSTERGMITLPVLVTAMADDVVFVPTHSAGSSVHSSLGIRAGDAVRITVGGAA
jgi:NADH-quinone oxidoreductase subunit G